MKTIRLFVVVCAVALTAFAGSDPTLEQAQQRAAVLRAQIARHDGLYFRQAAPEITDAQYDSLKRELGLLGERFPELSADTGIGDDRMAGFPPYRHRAPMLSLNKTHTEADLKAFINRLNRQIGSTNATYVIEPKYDGLGISVTYEDGTLVRAATRGDGTEGDEVTANLLHLSDVPRRLAKAGPAFPPIIELRGEVYMAYAEFQRINQERIVAGEEPYAHPRNLAVGTLRQPDGGDSPRRLEVVFYGVGAVAPAGCRPRSQQELHASIKAWGLPGVNEFRIGRSPGEVWSAIQALGRRRSALPYPIDGAVVKLDDLRQQAALGASAEAPRGAIAYKYPPETVSTRVLRIVLQIGRTGVLSPVAELAAVKIGGSTVRRATLHNRAEIARKDIRVGDWVFLEKAGDIIPAITGVDLNRREAAAGPFAFPDDCPSCGAKLVETGAAVRCPNYRCEAQVQRRVEHFASKGAVDIEGLGKVTVASLVRRGWVKEPSDLYALSREQLGEVTGPKTAGKLLEAIAASKTRESWRFIYGLGVPGIGPAGAKAIAKHFPDLPAWIRAGEENYPTDAISAAVRRASLAFFADDSNRRTAEALQRAMAPN
jgi:DNA ligase (NAD+)